MLSKTKINRKLERKTSSEIVETILAAKKQKAWLKIANLISAPRRKQASVNLNSIDEQTKEGDTILVPGKVLGTGNVSKKIRVAALYFSEDARKKLKDKKCEIVSVREEVKVNPKAQGIKVLR
ncbi:MAG: 50S ribosomal protein L18e [Nanoarchaeota archaeon]|nr:50S ribosomal protein L18e [Nanoarchaeota archaeon]MBU4086001.1 50S ribosomal protein L18e [Nanoarchaeota archaeon]